jgi:hypothetical protein
VGRWKQRPGKPGSACRTATRAPVDDAAAVRKGPSRERPTGWR